MADLKIAERVNREVLDNLSKTNAIVRYYSNAALRNVLERLTFEKRWRFLDRMGGIGNVAFQKLENYTEAIEVFLKHTPEAQNILAQNVELWLKVFESRILYKNENWDEISQLFNKPIYPSRNVSGFPNINFLTDINDSDNALLGAIQISNRADDVMLISNHTGIPLNILQKAKENYFIKERFTLSEVFENGVKKEVFQKGRFSKEIDDISQWNEAINGEFITRPKEDFLRLIAHEYVESRLIDEFGMIYRSPNNFYELTPYSFGAHDISPLVREGNGYFYNGRMISPPKFNLDNWDVLDDVVDWFVDFYKL